jgi:hypothetical protein
MKMREVVLAKCLTAKADPLELIKNDKRKINTIVNNPPIWQDKNNKYTQLLMFLQTSKKL